MRHDVQPPGNDLYDTVRLMRLLRSRPDFSLPIREVASKSSHCVPRDTFTFAPHLPVVLANARQGRTMARDRKLKERMIPRAWVRVERDVPVRPRKVRVTAAYDEELVKWFRAMGQATRRG